MGMIFAVHIIDAARYEQAFALFNGKEPPPIDKVKALQEKFGTTLDSEGWEPGEPTSNALFLNLVSEKAVVLDKAPNLGLSAAFRAVPELSALRAITFEGSLRYDRDLPACCKSGEGPLYGMWSAEVLRPLAPALAAFAARSDAVAYLTSLRSGFLERLFGGVEARKKAIFRWTHEDYLWKHWLALSGAIQECVAGSKYLGHEMSR